MPLEPHNQQLFRVSLAGEGSGTAVEAVFASNLTGQGWIRDKADYADPEESRIKVLTGFIRMNDVTLTSLYDASQAGLVTWIRGQKTAPTRFTCVIQPIDASLDANPVGEAVTMTGCQILNVTLPEMDRDQVGTARIQIVFRPEDIE
jgi:hypothetical protein